MGLVLLGMMLLPPLFLLFGAGQYFNINTQAGPTVDAAFVRALVQERHAPGTVELFFRAWSPFNRHQNFIVYHLDESQRTLLKQGKLQPAAAFDTNLDHRYSIYAQPHGGIERWGRYRDNDYLVVAVPTRYIAYLETFLKFVRPAEYARRTDPANYSLQQ